MTHNDILVLDKNNKPIGPITELTLVVDAKLEEVLCKIHLVCEENPKATFIENHTVNAIYKDGPLTTIIKLN